MNWQVFWFFMALNLAGCGYAAWEEKEDARFPVKGFLIAISIGSAVSACFSLAAH